MKRTPGVFAAVLWVLAGAVALALGSPSHEASDERPSGHPRIWRYGVTAGVLLLVLGLGGVLTSVSGIIPIKASAGHWPVTEWFLKFSMRRSISTHSLDEKVPLLDEQLTVVGAGHYETSCRPCHGSPDSPLPRVMQQMLPPPPDLKHAAHHWKPRELFYIVKHGIKMTGMPAWPTQQRDDEVWAMTKFLLELPEMDAEQYRQMALGPLAANPEQARSGAAAEVVPMAAVETCIRCHGVAGQGRANGRIPRLAGQSPEYLRASLQAYADRHRHSGIMGPVAAGLTGEQMLELSRYFAGRSPEEVDVENEDEQLVRRGALIAAEGIPARRVAACSGCHGASGQGRNPRFPDLAGQGADYLFQQLMLFHQDNRGGTDRAHLMQQVAAKMTQEQMRAAALYYQSLSPAN